MWESFLKIAYSSELFTLYHLSNTDLSYLRYFVQIKIQFYVTNNHGNNSNVH